MMESFGGEIWGFSCHLTPLLDAPNAGDTLSAANARRIPAKKVVDVDPLKIGFPILQGYRAWNCFEIF
jgi:hypothetical protein